MTRKTGRRARTLLIAGAVALLGVAGCSGGANQPSGAQVVAEFDGGEITQGQVQAELDRFSQQAGAEGEDISTESPQWEGIRDQVMPQLVTTEISLAYAEENGISADEDEVNQEIELTREQIFAQAQQTGQAPPEATPEDIFQETLSQAGFSEDEFREVVREGVTIQRVQEDVTGEVEPSEEEIETFYDENLDAQFTTPEQRCTRHILFNQDQEDQANEVLQELEDGGDWAELAQEYSQDPGSAQQDGELGCQPQGAFVEAFDEAVWEAEQDEIGGPVETEFGFHVFEVTEIQEESTTPLEEARPVIVDTLGQEQQAVAFGEWVQQQTEERNVTYLPEYEPAPPPDPAAAPEGAAPEEAAPEEDTEEAAPEEQPEEAPSEE